MRARAQMIPIGLTIILLAMLFIIIRLCISKELPVPTRIIVFVCAATALFLVIYWNIS